MKLISEFVENDIEFLISATLDDSATMTLTGGETVLIPKESTTKMYAANAAIKLTAVTHPRG